MQKNPDADASARLMVRKRDGRCVPFEAERLRASIRRALEASGSNEPHLGDDLAGVVITYLEGHADAEQVSAEEITEIVRQVLDSSGCQNASYVYDRVRKERETRQVALRIRPLQEREGVRTIPLADGGSPDAPDAWSKGRVVAMLETEAELPRKVAQQVASEVERGLFAAGLRSVSPGLVREWVDNELVLRGLAPRLGRHRHLAVDGHELRDLLARSDAEQAAAGLLLSRYALREVFPPAVARAHEQGLLHLGGVEYAGRLDSAVLSFSRLPAASSVSRLAVALRTVRSLCSHEVVLCWDRPTPTEAEAEDLLLGLAEGRDGARPVLSVPADETVLPFLQAYERLRMERPLRMLELPQLRVCGPPGDDRALAAVIEHETIDARVQFAAGPPEPGLVAASVSINLPRLVLCSERDPDALAERFERALELALSGLQARAALLDRNATVVSSLCQATGAKPTDFTAARRRLGLSGAHEALTLARHLGFSPSEVLGGWSDRLRARGIDRGGCGALGLELGAPEAQAARRFGRLDAAAHPGAKDVLELNAARDTYRYDGPLLLPRGADVGTMAERAAQQANILGLPSTAVIPRCTGGASERGAFVAAYLAALTAPADSTSCA